MKNFGYILSGILVLVAATILFTSAVGEAGPAQEQVVVPTAITINQTDSVKYMVLNTKELKLDYKQVWQLEVVENSGTVTETVTIQGTNFSPSANLWDDVYTQTLTATGDTTLTYDSDSPCYAFYRLKLEKATRSGNYSVTLNAGVKLTDQSK